MSIVVQWVIVGIGVALAILFLIRRLVSKPEKGCAGCDCQKCKDYSESCEGKEL